ncbi:hypothetical protein M231_05518 [Tremella mesenterica]|uniref:Protein kinase domain-containing protein n=1 Tax=Tremella mesenterica TaxID=5217 RepID=A0A4Q1BHW8_TREME|nr:hypothetical protein M231_05518 [Tremella mesenterica]
MSDQTQNPLIRDAASPAPLTFMDADIDDMLAELDCGKKATYLFPYLPILQLLVELQACTYTFDSSDGDTRPWCDIQTSGSLITINPNFPRVFTSSNHFCDDIVTPRLRQVCQNLEENMTVRGRRQWSGRFNNGTYCFSEKVLRMGIHLESRIIDLIHEYLNIHPCRMIFGRGLAQEFSIGPLRQWIEHEERFVSNVYHSLFLSDESGSKVNLTRAVVDIRSEMTAPIWVFQGIVKAVKVGSVRIDHEGRAIVTRKKTRKNIGRKVIAQVERLLTYGFFLSVKVTSTFRLATWEVELNFTDTLDPTRDLRFDKLSTMGELGRWGESMTSKACTIGENVTVKELGPPSLYVHIPKEYNFERVRRPDVGHSLLRARRWPNLLHGPVSYHLLTADLPILISPEISINKSCPFPTLRDSARSPSTIGVTEQSPLNHTSASPSCVFIPQSIVLGEPLSWGAMWDVFRITSPPDQPPLPFPMVAKIVAPEAFEVTPSPHFAPRFSDFVRGGTSQRQMRQSVKSELGVYTQLNNLTPPVIPRVLGLWGGTQRGQEVWVMIMEDAGEGLSQRGIQQLSEADKDAIRSLYRRIHQSGFLHGDVQNRHICRPKGSSDPTAFRLIDFDRGRLHGELSEEEWERELEKEKEAVESLLSQVYLSPTSSIAS